MNTNDTMTLIIVSILTIVVFFGFYFFGKWGNTTDSKIKKSSIFKSLISFVLIVPLALILLYLQPNNQTEMLQIVALCIIDVFLLTFLITFIKIAHEESKKRSKQTESNPLPLILVGIWMLFFLLMFISVMLGWKTRWV
jgi:regulatory protein YycI of two-component signal transduction system YycFG